MTLRVSEWIVVVYFLYLAVAALAVPLAAARRLRVVAQIAVSLAVVFWVARFDRGGGLLLRNFVPVAFILAMYWLPAELVTRTHPSFERMLSGFDRRCLNGRELTLPNGASRLTIDTLELAYLLCSPLIPVGMIFLYLGGVAFEADRYWTALLLGAALSYGGLPWLPTRPPRTVHPNGAACSSRMRALNLRVLDHASVQLNTFPSGHVATSLAAALAVTAAFPMAGAALGVLALGIAAASIIGRYHYVADVLAGAVVAVVAFVASRFV
jgi:membrane-associated phospholipid phosphatase